MTILYTLGKNNIEHFDFWLSGKRSMLTGFCRFFHSGRICSMLTPNQIIFTFERKVNIEISIYVYVDGPESSMLMKRSEITGIDVKSRSIDGHFSFQIHYVKVIILNFFLQNQDGPQSEHQKLACSRNLWVGNVGEVSPTNFTSFSSKSAPC